MADKMKYYNVTDFTKQKQQQEPNTRIPPEANFFAATNHVRSILEKKKLVHGFLGGLGMLCLGYRRPMLDLHVVYDNKDFDQIKKKLEADRR